MRINKGIITLSITTAVLLTGCSTTEFQSNVNKNLGKIGGVTIGAAAGAAIGNKIAGKEGMIVGALIGGTVGYFVGSNIDERRASLEKIAKEENVNIYFEDIKDDDGETIGQSFITEDKYQFNTASAKLNKKAKAYFKKFALQYAKSGQKVLIIGHTDDRGSDSYNYNLSDMRAKAVAQIFKDNGVDAKNIYIYGLGETKPISTNLTKTGQGKNRRVEIVEAPTEEDIAKYAYLKKTNSKLLHKEKLAKKDTEKIKKTKKLEKNKKVVNPKEFAEANIPKEILPQLKKLASNPKMDGIKAKLKGEMSTKKGLPSSSPLNAANTSTGKKSGAGMGSLPNIAMGNLMLPKIEYFGTGKASNKGECKNDFMLADITKSTAVKIDEGTLVKRQTSVKDFETVVGMPIESNSFSLLTKAHANTKNAFYGSCLEDSFKEKGKVTNFETGREVLIEKTVKQIPWLDGTAWYAQTNKATIVLSPISVSVMSVEPITCPSVNIIKAGANYPTYGVSTKVVTRQGDKGFIYRVYPTLKNENSTFECIDIAFSDRQEESTKGNLYYEKGGKYYKKELTFNRIAEVKKEKKGLFSW